MEPRNTCERNYHEQSYINTSLPQRESPQTSPNSKQRTSDSLSTSQLLSFTSSMLAAHHQRHSETSTSLLPSSSISKQLRLAHASIHAMRAPVHRRPAGLQHSPSRELLRSAGPELRRVRKNGAVAPNACWKMEGMRYAIPCSTWFWVNSMSGRRLPRIKVLQSTESGGVPSPRSTDTVRPNRWTMEFGPPQDHHPW